ncbi:uncharacterized protein LOC101861201 [Aplysia californica]|uniref:Uncharacterized protein LOC101861201 n=1 Tax=Aplysia californica TaxID=6500 RepID=A0ABM0JKD7_APLCA|nr:uncharacterized protein LOC101861201 [Aplysia californica]
MLDYYFVPYSGFMLLFLAIIVCNSLTIYVIAKNRKLRSMASNIFFLNLAVVDSLIGLDIFAALNFPMMFPMAEMIKLDCVLVELFFNGLFEASMLFTFAISVDRFVFIKWPLQYPKLARPRTVWKISATIWLISVLCAVFPLASPVVRHPLTCRKPVDDHLFLLMLDLVYVVFFVSTVASFLFYFLLLRIVRAQTKRFQTRSVQFELELRKTMAVVRSGEREEEIQVGEERGEKREEKGEDKGKMGEDEVPNRTTEEEKMEKKKEEGKEEKEEEEEEEKEERESKDYGQGVGNESAICTKTDMSLFTNKFAEKEIDLPSDTSAKAIKFFTCKKPSLSENNALPITKSAPVFVFYEDERRRMKSLDRKLPATSRLDGINKNERICQFEGTQSKLGSVSKNSKTSEKKREDGVCSKVLKKPSAASPTIWQVTSDGNCHFFSRTSNCSKDVTPNDKNAEKCKEKPSLTNTLPRCTAVNGPTQPSIDRGRTLGSCRLVPISEHETGGTDGRDCRVEMICSEDMEVGEGCGSCDTNWLTAATARYEMDKPSSGSECGGETCIDMLGTRSHGGTNCFFDDQLQLSDETLLDSKTTRRKGNGPEVFSSLGHDESSTHENTATIEESFRLSATYHTHKDWPKNKATFTFPQINISDSISVQNLGRPSSLSSRTVVESVCVRESLRWPAPRVKEPRDSQYWEPRRLLSSTSDVSFDSTATVDSFLSSMDTEDDPSSPRIRETRFSSESPEPADTNNTEDWERDGDDSESNIEDWERAGDDSESNIEDWGRAGDDSESNIEDWGRAGDDSESKAKVFPGPNTQPGHTQRRRQGRTVSQRGHDSVHELRRNLKLQKDIRAAKLLFLMFFVFVVCWLPCAVMFYVARAYQLPQFSTHIINLLGFSNSVFNFFVYPMKVNQFRAALRKTVPVCRRIMQENSSSRRSD